MSLLSMLKSSIKQINIPANLFRLIVCVLSINAVLIALVAPASAMEIPGTFRSASLTENDQMYSYILYRYGIKVAGDLSSEPIAPSLTIGSDVTDTYLERYSLYQFGMSGSTGTYTPVNITLSYDLPALTVSSSNASMVFHLIVPSHSYTATLFSANFYDLQGFNNPFFPQVSEGTVMSSVYGTFYAYDLTFYIDLADDPISFNRVDIQFQLMLSHALSGARAVSYIFSCDTPTWLYAGDSSSIAIEQGFSEFESWLSTVDPDAQLKLDAGQDSLDDMNDIVADLDDLEQSIPDFSADDADLSFFGNPSFSVVTDIFQRAWSADFFIFTTVTVFSIALFAAILHGKAG